MQNYLFPTLTLVGNISLDTVLLFVLLFSGEHCIHIHTQTKAFLQKPVEKIQIHYECQEVDSPSTCPK